MLNRYARALFTTIFTPVAKLFLRLGISPDAVTIIGTLGVCVGALAFYPRGELWWGTLFITAFVFTDLIDGAMARLSGKPSSWGAFLDSSMDRIGDGAILSGLVLYFTGPGDSTLDACLALACMVLGFVTSYIKARAEGLGLVCHGGIAERADRLVLVLAATGLVGLFLPRIVLTCVLALLVVLSLGTIYTRVVQVRAQTLRIGTATGQVGTT